MSSVIIWAVLLIFWIIVDISYVKRYKPPFWACWYFFFSGWTAAMFFANIGGLIH